ncbi:hypothetical protein BamIOP4010DRAFT_6475 [Burkholderia ambifaria IOP40-10]|uniref:Uncharacterized protein n=1 Tax=Burkholderia ambifaria IOP40-10 TaxID=396596 RepID=B1FR14_9BURK|nr:hypothetical protein BamIOP4010DRAFT_6475 [Burkholderia ambifaria IOP40-10]
MKRWRSACDSIAIAWHDGCARIHSMPIEPLPAPTSHNSSPGAGASRPSVNARMSRLVSWPSWRYASSGRPGVSARRGASGPARQSSAIRLSAAVSAMGQSCARPSRRRSSGPPRCSNTLMRVGPKPRAVSSAATVAGVRPSALSTNRRRPGSRWRTSVASGRPTSDTAPTSCSAQPSRAAASDSDDGAGSTRHSSADSSRASVAPTPNSIGSPLASTQTGASRRASRPDTSNGDGHGSRAARSRAGSMSRCRFAPTTRVASSSARRALRPSPA